MDLTRSPLAVLKPEVVKKREEQLRLDPSQGWEVREDRLGLQGYCSVPAESRVETRWRKRKVAPD